MKTFKTQTQKTLILLLAIFGVLTTNAQDTPLKLKYLGTAGWIIEDGDITVLIDPYISRVKLGTGPGVSPDDTRETVMRNDYFVSDTVSIDSLVTKADFILVHHSHFDHLAAAILLYLSVGRGYCNPQLGAGNPK